MNAPPANQLKTGLPTILLVEDSDTDAEITIRALHRCDIDCQHVRVRDGVQAIAYLNQEGEYAGAPTPDLVLLDLNLPGLDGRDVLASIKTDFALSTIPVIIMTASKLQQDRLRGDRMKVDGYLVKPLDIEKFLALVNSLADYWDSDVMLPHPAPH